MEPRARERGVFKAGEDVIGKRVVNLQGEDLGKIEDIIIDAPDTQVATPYLRSAASWGWATNFSLRLG